MNWIRNRIRPEQLREISLLFLILMVVIAFGTLIPHYYSARTFDRIASSVMIITILAGERRSSSLRETSIFRSARLSGSPPTLWGC